MKPPVCDNLQLYLNQILNFLIFLTTALPIVNAIKSAKRLTGLILEGNTLGVEAAKAIAKALESQQTFQRALWKDAFTGRLKDEIPKALVHQIFALIINNVYQLFFS